MPASVLAAQVSLPIVAVALLLLAVAALGVILWSVKRHRDPHLRIECDAPVSELVDSLAGLTHGSLLEGNAAQVLENGRFFDAMFEAIAQASCSVHFETYLWKEGVLGQRLVAALVERCRAGVQVRVMVDANGGKKMGRDAQRQLTEGGCRLVMFHRSRLRNLGRLNRRDHRKLLVIDGRVAFVGGHCIVDSWLGEAQDKEHFRDLGLRLTGSVVNALQSTFSENWIDETGELFVGRDVFPALEPAGNIAIHVARVKPEGSAPAVKILHHLAICLARERILIQNPYFLPKAAAIEALGQAVARGVDARLLASGVRIFEYRKTLLHQKTMVVDGVWCAVGSSNFDERSFEINDEITLGLRSTALARQLEAVFERDVRDCVELEHASWIERGAWHRFKDQALYLLSQQL